MAAFSAPIMTVFTDLSTEILSEVCVEVVAVVITLVCVSIIRVGRLRSTATPKYSKNVVADVESETEAANIIVGTNPARVSSTEDEVNWMETETETVEFTQVANRMVALFERITDIEVDDFAKKLLDECSEVSTECQDEVLSSSDEFIGDDSMDTAEWDDVSFRMGNLLKGIVDSESDSEEDQFLDDDSFEIAMMAGARCPVYLESSTVSAASILESYGVLGAASGTWSSTTWS